MRWSILLNEQDSATGWHPATGHWTLCVPACLVLILRTATASQLRNPAGLLGSQATDSGLSCSRWNVPCFENREQKTDGVSDATDCFISRLFSCRRHPVPTDNTWSTFANGHTPRTSGSVPVPSSATVPQTTALPALRTFPRSRWDCHRTGELGDPSTWCAASRELPLLNQREKSNLGWTVQVSLSLWNFAKWN